MRKVQRACGLAVGLDLFVGTAPFSVLLENDECAHAGLDFNYGGILRVLAKTLELLARIMRKEDLGFANTDFPSPHGMVHHPLKLFLKGWKT